MPCLERWISLRVQLICEQQTSSAIIVIIIIPLAFCLCVLLILLSNYEAMVLKDQDTGWFGCHEGQLLWQ